MLLWSVCCHLQVGSMSTVLWTSSPQEGKHFQLLGPFPGFDSQQLSVLWCSTKGWCLNALPLRTQEACLRSAKKRSDGWRRHEDWRDLFAHLTDWMSLSSWVYVLNHSGLWKLRIPVDSEELSVQSRLIGKDPDAGKDWRVGPWGQCPWRLFTVLYLSLTNEVYWKKNSLLYSNTYIFVYSPWTYW